MTTAPSQQLRWTISDLEGLPENGNRYGIIDGELFVIRAPHLDHDRKQQSIAIYRRETGILKQALTLFNADQLTSPLLPGFSCAIAGLF
jgi:Uma2 family endonuclease